MRGASSLKVISFTLPTNGCVIVVRIPQTVTAKSDIVYRFSLHVPVLAC